MSYLDNTSSSTIGNARKVLGTNLYKYLLWNSSDKEKNCQIIIWSEVQYMPQSGFLGNKHIVTVCTKVAYIHIGLPIKTIKKSLVLIE